MGNKGKFIIIVAVIGIVLFASLGYILFQNLDISSRTVYKNIYVSSVMDDDGMLYILVLQKKTTVWGQKEFDELKDAWGEKGFNNYYGFDEDEGELYLMEVDPRSGARDISFIDKGFKMDSARLFLMDGALQLYWSDWTWIEDTGSLYYQFKYGKVEKGEGISDVKVIGNVSDTKGHPGTTNVFKQAKSGRIIIASPRCRFVIDDGDIEQKDTYWPDSMIGDEQDHVHLLMRYDNITDQNLFYRELDDDLDLVYKGNVTVLSDDGNNLNYLLRESFDLFMFDGNPYAYFILNTEPKDDREHNYLNHHIVQLNNESLHDIDLDEMIVDSDFVKHHPTKWAVSVRTVMTSGRLFVLLGYPGTYPMDLVVYNPATNFTRLEERALGYTAREAYGLDDQVYIVGYKNLWSEGKKMPQIKVEKF